MTFPLIISSHVVIPEEEVTLTAIRAQGAGGQNVNKVSSAIHLRFDIEASSLPHAYKHRLLALRDSRISREGVLVIKAQQFRHQEQNREDALARLQALVRSVAVLPKPRIATKPTLASLKRRRDKKLNRAKIKQMRGNLADY